MMYRALIVDDDRWAIEDVRVSFRFEQWGFTVIAVCQSAEEALPVLLREKPELVISDIRMGDMSGLELIKTCRKQGLQSLFVIVSGYDDFCYVQDAFRYGVFFYLLKPLDNDKVDELMCLICEKLKHGGEIEQLSVSVEKQDTIACAINYINDHFTEAITLESVAEKVYLNMAYLSQALSKRLDMPFVQYRNGLRIRYAKQLIAAGYTNMTEIASKAGFESSSQFSRVFKRYENMTPQQFSKQVACHDANDKLKQ